jgi:hypothetical protein
MIRICPQTGEVLEAETKARAPGEGSGAPLELVTPRNAYASFQLALRLDGSDLANVRIYADPLRGERDELGPDAFSFYVEWYHVINGRYYPDALVPLSEGNAPLRTLQAITARNAVPNQAYAAIWVDVFLPAGIGAGEYRGAIHVERGGSSESHVIRVRALETSVPNESLIIADMNSYADNLSSRMDALRDNENRYEDGTYAKALQQFFRIAHEHRSLIHYLPYQHSGRMPAVFAPELEGKGKEMRVKDWSRFDEHFGPLLDGSAFKDTKRGAIPVPYMYLPFNFHWPADYVKFGTKGYRTEFTRILDEFHRHFTEKGWLRTKFELFLNHKKRYKLFPYDGDETRFLWDEKINDIFYDLMKDVLKKDGAKFVFRTDSSWAYGHHFEKFAKHIQLWVVNQQIFSWFPESLDVLRAAGDEVWTYGGAQPIQDTLLATTIVPLTAVARGVDGFTYWETNLWGERWYETPASNGSTAVFYPADRLFGLQELIPSIRLKVLRSAMQTADCMEQWIRGQPEGGRDAIRNIVVDAFGIQPDAWWPGKPDFLHLPPHEWENQMFSEAPSAKLHKAQDPETFNTLKRKLWDTLG